ncbi:MAG: CBS domain-containing protein [Deltaproteobacteria bacterium]|nr:CBS domain-containing protein [Deltaproteobacteria bacterium]
METLKDILKEKGFKVHSTRPDATVLEIARKMGELHIGSLLVGDGERTAGIVSERDIMNRVVCERRDPASTRARDIMTREVICAGADASPEEAMSIMTARRVRHLPIVQGGRVIGVVSIGDLIRWACDSQQHEIAQLTDYVCGRYPG